jgi:hypothetical protein
MRRTKLMQEIRKMRFEEVYERWREPFDAGRGSQTIGCIFQDISALRESLR